MVKEDLRIGVFVCDCGSNIAGFLDAGEVREFAENLPDVVVGVDIFRVELDGLVIIGDGAVVIALVFVGDTHDRKIVQSIDKKMSHNAVNLTGRTTLRQLAHLLRRCTFAIVNDSAPMHLASYLDVPVLALFGPTDPEKYGPWSAQSCFIRKQEDCPACQRRERGARHQCMKSITVKDVLNIFKLTPKGIAFK